MPHREPTVPKPKRRKLPWWRRGTKIKGRDGRIYETMKDGSWRRLK